MKVAIVSILLLISFNIQARRSHLSEPYRVEKRILLLSINLDAEMMALTKYKNLKTFCEEANYRKTIFNLLDEIHEYHDKLEVDLKETTYNHSKRTISRILKHMDKLENKFNEDDFTNFFKEQCSFQSRIEKYSDHYKAGFGTHSYGGQVYVQEVVLYRYLKRLTKRVESIKRHVEHFYIRRKVWEH